MPARIYEQVIRVTDTRAAPELHPNVDDAQPLGVGDGRVADARLGGHCSRLVVGAVAALSCAAARLADAAMLR